MRKYVAPEMFEYADMDTTFVTTDKALAIIVFEYAKEKSERDFADLKDEVSADLDSEITRLKKEIEETNERD